MTEVNRKDVVGATGVTFGRDPNNKVPTNDPVGSQKPDKYEGSGFAPRYDFLAYLKFEGGKLKVRTAYFESAAGEDLAKVGQRFASISGGQWPSDAEGTEENFDYFGFGGQTRLYFSVDNGTDVIFDDASMLTMTMFQAKDKKKTKPLPKDNSFWNIRVRNSILSAENWYAYENGKIIKDAYGGPLPKGDEVEFSMNIHLLMNCAGTGTPNYVPIVIDPDGTNGMNKP